MRPASPVNDAAMPQNFPVWRVLAISRWRDRRLRFLAAGHGVSGVGGMGLAGAFGLKRTVSGEEAYGSLAKSTCPLVKK